MQTPVLLLAFALASGALAGCIGTSGDDIASASLIPGLPRLTTPGSVGQGTAPAGWTGSALVAEESDWQWTPECILMGCPRPEIPCNETNCERIPFTVELPADYWQTHTGALEVSILWSHTDEDWRWFSLELYDARGTKVATGMGGIGKVLLLPEAPPGDYEAVVKIVYGKGAYEGVVQIESEPRDAPARDLLPDLVVLPPTELRIETPPQYVCLLFFYCQTAPSGLKAPLGAKGCSTYEATEGGAKRCLRFSNYVGNAGEGPMEVRLEFEEGAKAVAGTGAHVQRVHRSDGTFTEHKAGPATYHATHEHFHYEGLNAFAVYEYDTATNTRGALVNTGHKGGICLVDIGLIALGMPDTSLPNYDITCFYPIWTPFGLIWGGRDGADMSMSLSPNWYDLYWWGLDDMYVDIGDAPDGTYELVSSTNLDGSLVEADRSNNEASVVFRLTGDNVEVLKVTSGYGA